MKRLSKVRKGKRTAVPDGMIKYGIKFFLRGNITIKKGPVTITAPFATQVFKRSVPVVIRLIRTFDRYTDVVRLFVSQSCQLCA